MPELQKAILQPITADANPRPMGEPIIVQFNPSSLRLRSANQVEGGRTRGRQARQFVGSSSTTLTLELIFDSADEGTTEQPRSVREKVMPLQRLILPDGDNNETPPKVRFHWSDIVVDGVVTSLDVDYDLFAHNGVPLRAKVGFAISEQDSRYHFLSTGPGAREAGGSDLLGLPAGAPGGPPAPPGERVATALAGETAPDFAARMGLDPQSWRGLDVDLSVGLTLQAGIEVGFSGSLSKRASLGLEAGFRAGASISPTGGLEAALGLSAGADLTLPMAAAGDASATGNARIGADMAAGFLLAGAGGVISALEVVKAARAGTAAASARAAFAASGPGTHVGASVRADLGFAAIRPAQPRTPLARDHVPVPHGEAGMRPALFPPSADPRSITYGFGVPLKPRRGAAVSSRTDVISSFLVAGGASTTSASGAAPETRDRTQAPWVALPASDRGQATKAETKMRREGGGSGRTGRRG